MDSLPRSVPALEPRAAEDREPGVAAVDRALSILGAFRDGERALTLSQLAGRTGLYKSTILRLLASLERQRCAQRLPDGRWALGPMLFRWGSLYASARLEEAHLPAALEALARETGETATYWVRQGEARLCLMRVRGASPIRDDLNPGDLLPLPAGAGGRLLSAPDPRGLRTVATFGERNPETAGIAAPVFGADGMLAGAIAVSGPRARMEARAAAHQAAVTDAAERLTRRLGGDLAP